MHRLTCVTIILVAVAFLVLSPSLPAQSRVFVSGSGSDLNSCAITAPCRSFQRAHDVVTAGGEIVALDSAGYGAVSITKSVSIVAPGGLYAGITALTGDAVYAHGTGIDVLLRGLDMVGAEATSSRGIFMDLGVSLTIDRCRISHFEDGVVAQGVDLVVQDSILVGNTNSALRGTPNVASVVRSSLVNGGNGLLVDSGTGKWSLRDTVCGDNEASGVNSSSATASVVLVGCMLSGNFQGITAMSGATITVSGSTVTGNDMGVLAIGGFIESAGNNVLRKNTVDGAFSSTFALQ